MLTSKTSLPKTYWVSLAPAAVAAVAVSEVAPVGRGRGGRGGRGGGSANDFLVPQQRWHRKNQCFRHQLLRQMGEKILILAVVIFLIIPIMTPMIKPNREYIDSEADSEIYTEENTSNTKNLNHRLNFRIEYEIDSVNSIIMRPRLSFQQNEGISATIGETNLNKSLLNRTNNVYRSDFSGLDFSNNPALPKTLFQTRPYFFDQLRNPI